MKVGSLEPKPIDGTSHHQSLLRWTETRIHVMVDGCGLPVKFFLTPGQTSDKGSIAGLSAISIWRGARSATAATTPRRSATWSPGIAPSLTFRPGRTARSSTASAPRPLNNAIWSSGSSTNSNTTEVSSPATTNSQGTSSTPSVLRQSLFGLRRPRPTSRWNHGWRSKKCRKAPDLGYSFRDQCLVTYLQSVTSLRISRIRRQCQVLVPCHA